MAINKGEYSTPLYQQHCRFVVKAQRSEIAILKEDDRLGSRAGYQQGIQCQPVLLCEKHSKSLADEGYVTKRQGIGTFVSAKKVNNFNEGRGKGIYRKCAYRMETIPSSELDFCGLGSAMFHPSAAIFRFRRRSGFESASCSVNATGYLWMVEDGYSRNAFSYLTRVKTFVVLRFKILQTMEQSLTAFPS